MSNLPREALKPEPGMDDAGFWSNCADRRLTFQQCGECGYTRHPPTPVCAKCGSFEVTWREAPSRGQIYTYTVIHHPTDEFVRQSVPYVVAVIEFPEMPELAGVRLVSNVSGDPEKVSVGMPVELVWEAAGDDMSVPCFRPVAG